MEETDQRVLSTVFLDGLLVRPRRPYVVLGLSHDELVGMLREALNRRIVTGTWGMR